ncbi:MAG: hypothetical protein RBT81_06645 [Gammaproteobacteria bacterium]|nr:hypothetical protein [Gammaproteobacteria bacterium]
MTITLNFALWTLLTLGATASAGLVMAARMDESRSSAPWLPLGAAACVLLAVIFGADPQALFNRSPYGMYLLQSCLPLAGLVVTAYLACRWYIYRPERGGVAGLPAAFAAVLVAAGATILFVMPETATGVAVAVMAALVLGGISGRMPPAALRATGLTAAACSLWAAGFLVYLTVFPDQIAVGMEQPADGTGPQFPIAELVTLSALGAAFVLGFLKIRRG